VYVVARKTAGEMTEGREEYGGGDGKEESQRWMRSGGEALHSGAGKEDRKCGHHAGEVGEFRWEGIICLCLRGRKRG